MTEKYKWKGVNISDITNTTSVDQISTNLGFDNYPATYTDETSTELSTAPAGFVSNVNFSELSVPNNGYYCYTEEEDEDNEAPPFNHDGQSIFAIKTSNKRIIVKNDSFTSGSSTISIPEWCNAIKLYFVSIKGADGSPGKSLAAKNHNKNNDTNNDNHQNENENINHDNFTGLFETHHNTNLNNNHDQQINEHNNINWTATSGGSGGTGGTGKIGYFPRLIKFNSGTNNKLVYSINTAVGGTSTVNIKENNSTSIASVTYVSGSNAGNGGDAVGIYNNKNIETEEAQNKNINNTTNDNADENINHKNWNHEGNQTTQGDDGDDGTAGSVNLTSNNIEYLYYNNTSQTTSVRLKVYYFKYE